MKVVYSWQGFLFSENKLVGKRTSCRHPHIHNHFSTGWKDASWEQLELKNIFKYKCAFFKRFFSSSFICPSYWIVFFFLSYIQIYLKPITNSQYALPTVPSSQPGALRVTVQAVYISHPATSVRRMARRNSLVPWERDPVSQGHTNSQKLNPDYTRSVASQMLRVETPPHQVWLVEMCPILKA